MSDIGCCDGRKLEVCETLAARGSDARRQNDANGRHREPFVLESFLPCSSYSAKFGGREVAQTPTHQWNFTGSCNLGAIKGGWSAGRRRLLPLRRLLAQFDPRRLLASPPLAHLARGTSPTLVRGRGGEGGGAGSLQLLEVTPRCLRQVFPKSSHLNTAHTVLAKLEDSSPSHSTHLVRAVCAEA